MSPWINRKAISARVDEMVEQEPLTEAVESGRRWWEPYPHTTDVEKAQALVAACEYWHAAFECAIDTRDVALAEVDRLRGLLSQTAHDVGEEGYAKWSSDLHRAISGALDEGEER